MPRINVLDRLHLGDSTRTSVSVATFDSDFAKLAQSVVNGLQNSLTHFGHATPNVVGTAVAGDPPTDDTGVYVQYTSTTGNAALAGWVVNTTISSFRFDDLPTYLFHFQTGGDVSNVRYWIGFITVGNGAQTAATPNNFVAFRYLTPTVGDTTWHTITVDGAGTATTTDTGITPTADTSYYMVVQVVSTSEVRFYLTQSDTFPTAHTLVATHTTNFPAGSQQLGPTMGLNNGTSGAGRAIRCGYMRGRHH